MALRYLLSWLLLILLSACVSAPQTPQQVNRDSHQQRLAKLENWRLQGRLAFKSAKEKFSASINWQQKQRHFDLTLSHFTGLTLMQMRGQPGFVELEADDQIYRGTDPSQLIWQVTGWNIPVGKLPLWIKGQVEAADQATYDQYGLVQQLNPTCQGCGQWQIDFQRYIRLDDLWLPSLISLRNRQSPDNQVKIKINTWTQG